MKVGLLAAKRFENAKSRLAPDLSQAERESVARSMFEDALDLCHNSPMVEWFVVSDSDEAISLATEAGFGGIKDDGHGLNAALVQAIAAIEGLGASSVLVLPGDVPLTTPEDIADIVDTGDLSDVVVVPSTGDGGTNALSLTLPPAIAPNFGEGSLVAHIKAAEVAGVRCSVLPLERMDLDIDTPADIEAFLKIASDRATSTERFLRSLRT